MFVKIVVERLIEREHFEKIAKKSKGVGPK